MEVRFRRTASYYGLETLKRFARDVLLEVQKL